MMGFNKKGKSIMEKAADDLNIFGATFIVKPVHILKRNSVMTFRDIPITTDLNMSKQIIMEVLKPVRQNLTKDNPVNFRAF